MIAQEKKSPGIKEVEFSFYAPEAREVCLSGEFNQWDTRSLPMQKDEEGIWRLMLELNAGSYEFKFWVDGTWFEDLAGAQLVPNPFGTQNYVVAV